MKAGWGGPETGSAEPHRTRGSELTTHEKSMPQSDAEGKVSAQLADVCTAECLLQVPVTETQGHLEVAGVGKGGGALSQLVSILAC